MNKNKTERQHYVQCKYLEKWADKESRSGRVLVSSKDGKIINKPIGIDDLSVESYFYDVTTLSEDDIFLLNLIIKDLKICGRNIQFNSKAKEELKSSRDYLEKTFINEIENINNTNYFIDRIIRGETSFYHDAPMVIMYKNVINAFTNALYTDSNCEINFNDVYKTIDEYKNDDKYNFLLWFYYQFFRTKKCKELLVNTFDILVKERKEFKNCNLNNIANTHYIILAIVAAHNTNIMNTHITIYKCKTSDNFITSDCPVSPIITCKINEYIYPVSPKCLIKLSLNEGENLVVDANKLIVQRFNNITKTNAYNYIYKKYESNI